MQKIIFFDIDGTIFNVRHFLTFFNNALRSKFVVTEEELEKIKALYDEVKFETGYFKPSLFLAKVSNNFPHISLEDLSQTFNNIEFFEKSVYKDSPSIIDLSKSHIIGIYSEGDSQFQKTKIKFLDNYLDESNVYVFEDKLAQSKKVFEKYNNFDTYLVDNNLSILLEIKKYYPKIHGVLIDREDSILDNKGVTKIKTLDELKKII